MDSFFLWRRANLFGVLLLACLLCPRGALADVVVFGDPGAPPFDQVLPALRVQVPEQDQVLSQQPLPDSPGERTSLARSILSENPEAVAVIWMAPEDAPYDGAGPYSLTLVRRLEGDDGIEQVRVDAKTGTNGARIAALRVAELIKTAPDAPPVEPPESTSESDEELASPSSPGHSLTWWLAAGGAARMEPDGWLPLAGPEVSGGFGIPWPGGGALRFVVAGTYFIERVQELNPGQWEVGGADVALRARLVSSSAWAWGGELGLGARSWWLFGRAGDGATGEEARWSPLLSAHAVVARLWGPLSVSAAAGIEVTPLTYDFAVDGLDVLSIAGWSPSLRLELGFAL